MPTVLVKDKTFEVKSGEKLYDELEKQGYILPHGCLAGSCGACRIEIISGAENLSTPSAVELDTLLHLHNGNPKLRLSCRAKVLGDIAFKF